MLWQASNKQFSLNHGMDLCISLAVMFSVKLKLLQRRMQNEVVAVQDELYCVRIGPQPRIEAQPNRLLHRAARSMQGTLAEVRSDQIDLLVAPGTRLQDVRKSDGLLPASHLLHRRAMQPQVALCPCENVRV